MRTLISVYQSTALRRFGDWRQNLNVELSNPFTRQIASSWSKVFEADLFASFEKATTTVIQKLVDDVVASAAPGLKERARGQGELAMEDARVALGKTLEIVRSTMNEEQKEVSRCLEPHVKNQLLDGYERAMDERGRGSVARQKVRSFMCSAGCVAWRLTVGCHRLSSMTTLRGLKITSLRGLRRSSWVASRRLQKQWAVPSARPSKNSRERYVCLLLYSVFGVDQGRVHSQIEVNMAVLWEGPRDDPKQAMARGEVVEGVKEILRQVELWRGAEQLSRVLQAYTNENEMDPMDIEIPTTS